MLEVVAIIFFFLWVVGLLGSYGGLAIHVFLVFALGSLGVRTYLDSRARSVKEVSPAGILAIMTRKSREEGQ